MVANIGYFDFKKKYKKEDLNDALEISIGLRAINKTHYL